MSNRRGFTDYHVHPGYSIDAAPVSIDEYCIKAIELQLAEICFTPHLEVDPVRKHIDWFVRWGGKVHQMDDWRWLEQYFADIHAAQQKYYPDLKVKAGIEVGFEPGYEKQIEMILSNFPFDFVLGSIHCLNHIAISSKKECPGYFMHKNGTQVARDYFTMLEAAVKTGLFDCIAHIDLYRRYGKPYLGNSVKIIHQGYIERILQFMSDHKMALEINTSGLRRGLNDLHPSITILETAVQQGIKFYTTGSDAHSIDELGKGLDQAEKILSKYSLSITTFTNRQPERPERVDKPTHSTIK
ncbi:histidinol-phosphatase [Desulfallas sp. Bu1-1]|uniref:histidinol-phosphatase n=1 Tax=Desulfallas sp. Bu1-1 TaxID=2787620 RepID=UPI0018A12107|nr:histidinol-phosphatase [Desulfallas sp. Bu1-1]MBF7083285.1 histidinol-phosphatase [Desulfallas sp. Bu1-1]